MKESKTSLVARREFLSKLGRAAACAGAAVSAGAVGVVQNVAAKSGSAEGDDCNAEERRAKS